MKITHKDAAEVSAWAPVVPKCDSGKIHLQVFLFFCCQSLGSYRLLARNMFHRKYESFHKVANCVSLLSPEWGFPERKWERE